MEIELEDWENGRPIVLRTTNDVAHKIQELKPKKMYRQILELANGMPSTKEKYLIKANAEMHLKMWRELAVTCDRGLDIIDDANFYNLKGKALGKLGNFAEKAELTRKAIELDPNVAAFYRNLGAAYYKLKNYPEALTAHERAISLEPESAINYHNKGAALFRMGRFEEAKRMLQQAISIDSKQVISHSWLGDTERELGDFATAKVHYARAYELSANDFYKEEMRKMDEKIAPERKKGFLFRLFG